MQKTTPFLWFNDKAEEAANFYVGIFPNSKIISVTPTREDALYAMVTFELDGQEYIAFNGGPAFAFTEAVSLMVKCETQEELDYYWTHLSAGGKEVQCGWLQDKYGLFWQITPSVLEKWLQNGTPEQKKNYMAAMMQMVKLDIKALEQAYENA